jgi:hypothetical protein
MVKWKCVLCDAKCESEVKPNLGQRLCKPCLVVHWKRVVSIYSSAKGIRFEEARVNLAAAERALKADRAKKEVKA